MANCEQMLMGGGKSQPRISVDEKIVKRDIVWLDYARFIGIFLVIFGHSLQRIPNWQDLSLIKETFDYIYLFHMPLFFIISGYLYSNNKGEKLQIMSKLFYSLILPYLIYQFAYTPIILTRHSSDITNLDLWMKILMGILDGDGYDTSFSMSVCLPCWFIISIIQIRLLFMFIHINKTTAFILSLLSIIFLVIRKQLHLDFYFCIDTTIMAIPYFLSGYYIKQRFDRLQNISIAWLLLFTLLFGIFVYIDLTTNGAAQMNGPSYGKYILLNYSAGFLGSMMIFLLSIFIAKIFKENTFVKTISRHTLFIIFFHWVLMRFVSWIFRFRLLYGTSYMGYISLAVVLSVFILLISYIAIFIWSEKYPIVFGKKK